MIEPHAERLPVDRRWYPVGDAGEWERTTRESVFESVRKCMSHAIYPSLSTEVSSRELHASDAVFRELHLCAQGYARALYDLGQGPDGAARLIVAAAKEAAAPFELHASIVSALQQWCHEANVVSS
jgi:hypothetical protein